LGDACCMSDMKEEIETHMYGWAGVRRYLLGLVEVMRMRHMTPINARRRPVTLRFLCPTQCYANQKGVLHEDSWRKKI